MPIFEQLCKSCGKEFEILVLSANSDAPRPCPECGCADTLQLISRCSFRMASSPFEMKRGTAHNPYDNLTLDHIKGEDGKPIKVNSERELRAAEKKYNFVHAASWGLENQAPQHDPEAGSIYPKERRKWNKDDAAYAPDKVAEAAKEVGYVKSASETLAYRPNPI